MGKTLLNIDANGWRQYLILGPHNQLEKFLPVELVNICIYLSLNTWYELWTLKIKQLGYFQLSFFRTRYLHRLRKLNHICMVITLLVLLQSFILLLVGACFLCAVTNTAYLLLQRRYWMGFNRLSSLQKNLMWNELKLLDKKKV